MRDEEMVTETLSDLSKVALLMMAGMGPDPGQTYVGSCLPDHCMAEEGRHHL